MGSNDPADREDIALSTSELDDVLSSAEIRSESGNDDESELEKYGIWIKVEPETLEGAGAMPAASAGGSHLTAEEEQLLGELESEAPTLSAQASAETADFEGLEKDLQELDSSGGEELDEEVADLDLDLENMPEEPGREPEIEVPLSDSLPELDSLEEAAEAEVRTAGPLSSDAILKKIEQDLKQIKLEIQTLKKELAGRGGEAGGPHPAAPGFFAEEEDDSIALTGDELDNILNTADFTEEQAELPEEDLQAAGLPEAVEELEAPEPAEALAEPMEELAEPMLDEPMEELAAEPAPVLAGEEIPAAPLAEAEDLDLLEPGSLSAEPEQAEIELEEKPTEVDLDLGGMAEELPPAGDLELEELEEDGAPELVLEDAGDSPLPQAEELGLEEAAPEFGLEELSAEPAAEPLELGAAAEAQPSAAEAAAEPLELVEELPDLSLTDAQPESGGAAEAPAEPIELELMEEPAGAEPVAELPSEAPAPRPAAGLRAGAGPAEELPEDLREDVKSVLSYLDQLLEALPEDKIKQFAQSEYFGVYKRLFEELGLGA